MSQKQSSAGVYPPALLLIISAVWAPIAGGYVSTDAQSLSPSINPFLAAITGDPAVPYLSHALIALPAVLALIWVLLDRMIQQVPSSKVSVPLALLLGLVIGTAPLSQSKMVTVPAAAEWLLYGVAFFATVAVAGRRLGPLGILTAIFGGCVILSLIGLREYGEMRPTDPTWRIFGHWIGPNALAGMLLVGLILGIAITLTRDRLQALLAGIGTSMIGFAFLLTQSKGGLVALALGIAVFLVTLLLWARHEGFRSLARVGAIGFVIIALAIGLQMSQQQAASAGASDSPAALSRFANAQQTQEQSFGFRKLLWQGSVELMKQNPAGFGAGTYRFWSARPGLTTVTQFAHNSYLQLGVESSVLSVLALLALLALWTSRLFKNPIGLPIEQRILRAGVFGAVVAVAAHSIVDSDLHYFGIGFVFFILLGVGLLLSTDAVAPEYTPMSLRYGGAMVAGFVAFVLLWSGWIEAGRSQVRGALQERAIEQATAQLDSLRRVASADGEVWYLTGLLASTANDRLLSLQRAVELQPWTRNLRALARSQVSAGLTSEALETYNKALSYDPNNLPALAAMMDLYIEEDNATAATNVARKLVGVEKTPYYQVRSQPDIVPTETAAARVYLAAKADARERNELLEGALRIYKEYASRTIPQIQKFAASGMDFAGQNPKEGQENLEAGRMVALELAQLYRDAGRLEDARLAEEDAASFSSLKETFK